MLGQTDDPKTTYYFLSTSKGDVGDTTGWVPGSDGANQLHLAAVGQMLAFTRQALKTPPRDQKWRTRAVAELKRWEVVYKDILHESPPSEYWISICTYIEGLEYLLPYNSLHLDINATVVRDKLQDLI